MLVGSLPFCEKLWGLCFFLLLYVDDILLIATACKYEIDKLEDKLYEEFVVEDLGAAKLGTTSGL